MNRSQLLLEYILDRRAGVLDEYSVPATTTYLVLPADRHGREGGDGLQDCAIPRLPHSLKQLLWMSAPTSLPRLPVV